MSNIGNICGSIFIVLFLCGCCFCSERPLSTMSSIDDLVDAQTVAQLNNYPYSTQRSEGKRLLLRVSSKPDLLFSSDKKFLNSKSEEGGLTLNILNNEVAYNIQFKIEINSDIALAASINHAIYEAQMCSRGNTWNVYEKVPEISSLKGINFISHLTMGKYDLDNMNYCIENFIVSIKTNPPLLKTLQSVSISKVATKLNDLFDPKIVGSKYSKDNDIICTVVKMSLTGVYELKWAVGDSLSEYWIRMDIEAGKLSIENDSTVKASSVPATGSTVYLYAISPDGLTCYKQIVRIH